MARPRSNRAPETLDAPSKGIDHAALEEAGNALSVRAEQIGQVEAEYGVDLPYNLDLYIARMRNCAVESAQRFVEIGRILVIIRERETRDVFMDALGRGGITPRFAQRCMQAAIKLHDRPLLQQLGVSKALELLAEDDDTLDALEAGGTLAGRTFDELDTMSVRELKETLRAERRERDEEKQADEEIIRAKDERINKLTREKRKGGDVRAKADELLRDADDAAVEATSQIGRMRELHAEVDALYAEAGLTVDPEVLARLEHNAQWAATQLRELADLAGE